MKRFLITFLGMFCLILSVKAQTSLAGTTPESPIAIEHGKSYLFPTDFSIAYFCFTSAKDGLLHMNMSQNLRIFSCDTKGNTNHMLPIYGKSTIIEITAGKTYYFQSTTTWGAYIIMDVSFEEGKPYLPLELLDVSPKDGSRYHTTYKEGNVTFTFNGRVSTEDISANLTLANGEEIRLNDYQASEDYNTQGTIYTLHVAEIYKSLLEDGKLNAGEKFDITLSNIADPSNAENRYEGKLKVTYTATATATKLVSVDKTEKLKSYYMPGDEEGIITLSFSAPISSTAQSAILAYGDREAGTWKEIQVPYTIEGNCLKWNIQGLHLNDVPEDTEGIRYVSIYQRELYDNDGQAIESNTKGSPGTISLNYAIEMIEVNIYADFQPATGSCIDDVEEIEIWVAAGKYITFDGATITCQSNSETKVYNFTKDELRLTDDPYSADDLLIYIPVKDCHFDAGEVMVSLTNVMAANGTSPVIQGTYISEGKVPQSINNSWIQETSESTYFRMTGEPIMHPRENGIYLKVTPNKKVKKILIR